MGQELSYQLQSKQQHLLALLYVVSADGAQVFTQLPESIQSLYLSACAELAQECVAITEDVPLHSTPST